MTHCLLKYILDRLIQEFPDLLDRVDLVTGASNGGMVAMGMRSYLCLYPNRDSLAANNWPLKNRD